MLNVLVKKQFREVFRSYFINPRTGKMRSKGGVVGMIIAFTCVMAFLAGYFAFNFLTIGGRLVASGRSWLYFCLAGFIAIVLGVFGSVFSTYATLYIAKDNELLLALPIPPRRILLSRLVAVAALGLLYSGVVWLPAVICYYFLGGGAAALVMGLVLTIFVTLFVTALTAILGWVVAALSVRLKGKSFVTVIIALAAFGIYYFFIMRAGNLISALMESGDSLKPGFMSWGFVIYQLALGSTGDWLGFGIFVAITSAVFAVTMFVLARTFIRIVTTQHGSTKTVAYREKEARLRSPKKALFMRELKRFTSSATYMLNAGFGLVMEVAVAVLAIIFSGKIREVIAGFRVENPVVVAILPVILLAGFIFISVMNYISTPSVSLEGDRIWVVQSLPVTAKDVLLAKHHLHVFLNCAAAAILGITLVIVLELGLLESVLVLATVFVFIEFTGMFGLFLGLKNPNLHWTTEAQPIKQSMSAIIMLLGGMLLAAAVGGLIFLVVLFLDVRVYIAIWLVIFAVLFLLLYRWVTTKGALIFEDLS